MKLLTFCFRNLFRRKLRTTLCILGVALATAFVISVGATTTRYITVIKSMNVLFSGQIMVVTKGAIVIQAIPITRGMLPESLAVDLKESFQEVEDAVPVLLVTPSIYFGNTLLPVPENFSIGIPIDKWHSVLGPIMLKGGHLPTNDTCNEVVVGGSLAKQYDLTVGTMLQIREYNLTVVGVLDTKSAVLDRFLVMPLRLAQEIYGYQGKANIILIKPSKGCEPRDLAAAIENHADYKDSVKALTEEERNDIVQPIFAQIESWNIGIQSVVFVMSLILVMTVNLMSVSERRRDFATLDALGAPISYIFRIVIFEAAIIGILGGILGIALGSIAAVVLASLYTNIPIHLFLPGLLDIVTPAYMVQIFATVVAVCCLGGVLPAANAAKMRIAEVLRAEY
ncbi:MAG: FtsX-like permease family protein [Candidatus Bathyarchaeia archaeon]